MPIKESSLETLLAAAVEIDDKGQREAYVQRVCAGDSAQLAELQSMIHDYFAAGSLIDRPAAIMPTVDWNSRSDIGRQIGPYKLLEQIGEGGMGVVYVAEQKEPVRRKVALKVIKPGMDTQQVVARFEAERQALAMMNHPNIAKVLDAGATEAGRPYFVMELVKGVPITEFCDQQKTDTRQRLQLFITLCQAVQHAHQKGLIHRDLKPSNVLVEMHDVTPVPKVIDFGVAKAIGQQLTEKTLHTGFSQMIGTPLYMSPEQAGQSSIDVDTRSDIYSLGVLLYELLTGTTPFDKDILTKAGYDELRRIIREDEPPRPSARVSTLQANALSTVSDRRKVEPRKLSGQLRGELDWIVMKSLEKDRNRRYESASALAADVERYLKDEPVQACPPSVTYRWLKVARRYKAAAMVAAMVTFTILGSAAFSAGKYVDERAARRDAEEQKLAAFRSARKAENQATEATRQRGEAVRQKAEVERQRNAARQNLYFADTRLAYVDIGFGNPTRARDSLLSHFPDQGEADHRSWEWHYLLGRSHEAEQALYGHWSDVDDIAWSPDGNYIASASYDGSARVWDAKTGKQLRCFDQGSTIKTCIGWSPDSRKLAWGSAMDEAALRVWNRDTDKIAIVYGHLGSIWAVAWSHDGKYVATGSIHHAELPRELGNVRIWDVETLESVAQFTSAYHALSVSWSPDDKLLGVADSSGDGRVIWDIASQQQLPDIITERATCVAWHPTDPQLAVGDNLGNCLIWDRRSQTTIRQWKAHQAELSDLKWSGDGTRLLSSGHDGMVKLWDAREGRELKSLAAHAGFANSVAWDPSGRRFASCGSEGAIRVWTAESRPSPLVIDTKLHGTLDLAWDNESSGLLLASGEAGKIGVWEARSGKMLEEIPVRQDSNRRLVSFRHVIERSSSPGNAPAVVSVSGVPASDWLAKAVSPAAFKFGQFRDDAGLSPDRRRIAYISGSTPYYEIPLIRDLDSDRVVQCSEVYSSAGAAWSPNGRLLAVVGHGSNDDGGNLAYAGWVHVFDTDSGKRLRKLRIGTARLQGTAVAWSHDGRKFAAGNAEGLCEIWASDSGRKLVSARIHSSRVNDVAWSLDDQRVASGGIDAQVRLWDSSTGQQLLALEPHGNPICHIRWSPDGQKLAAVSEDGVIRVWDATKGYELPRRDFWGHLIGQSQRKEFARLIDEEHWSEAADLLKKLIAAGGPDDDAMSLLARVHLQRDDQAAYRDTCQRMLATFAGTEGINEACSTAWVCALRPGALDDYALAITLARKALDLKINARTGRATHRAKYPETLGAILFRAGQSEEALRHMQAAWDRDAFSKQSPARIAFLLAMIHQRLGHAADARMWLERANKEADEELTNTAEPSNWGLRLELSLFQREARELIGVQTKTGQQPQVNGLRTRQR